MTNPNLNFPLDQQYRNPSSPTLHQMIKDVRLFHQVFGHPIISTPTIPSPERQVLRSKLLRDEYIKEFVPAWAKCAALKIALFDKELTSPGDVHDTTEALAEMADVIADMIYYLIGTALEYGLPLDKVWDAVQQANMIKLWTYEESEDLPADWSVTLVEIVGMTGESRCWSVKDETGKVRKPPSWKEPNILAIIQEAMKTGNDDLNCRGT